MYRIFSKLREKISVCVTMIKSMLAIGKKKPPIFIPLKWLSAYTMNGRVKIRYWYFNDICISDGSRYYKKEQIDRLTEKVRNKEAFYYGKTDIWIYQALEKYSIAGQDVAIIGSGMPVYESICIYYGARPITIDYQKIVSYDERLRAMTVEEYDNHPVKCDSVFSISSFEHDGLGRYGDPLNPEGDLLAMKKMRSILKPGGVLFLAVPIGRDSIVWNAHRIYGRLRLPLLLEGWQIVETFGFDKDMLDKQGFYQPIFVLRNNYGKT